MIRQASTTDFDFIYQLYMHPQINPWLLYEPMDAISFQPIYEDLVNRNVLYVYENNGVAAGMCKLIPQQYRNAHILYLGGVGIHSSFAGKGEGINMMHDIILFAKQKGFKRIELSVASINERAIHLYEKAGFVKEGHLRNFTYLKSEDKFLDEVMMACLL
jgi:RimJ/RimL family protein N-acetyltransferase